MFPQFIVSLKAIRRYFNGKILVPQRQSGSLGQVGTVISVPFILNAFKLTATLRKTCVTICFNIHHHPNDGELVLSRFKYSI